MTRSAPEAGTTVSDGLGLVIAEVEVVMVPLDAGVDLGGRVEERTPPGREVKVSPAGSEVA